jgi:RimJ/RimL family protein N-acetyltransferase
LICLIDKNNFSSIRIAEKMGTVFEIEGEDEKGPFMLFSINNATAL